MTTHLFLHWLTGLMFIYALVRFILPLPVSGKIKLPATALLLLISQQHVLMRYAFDNIASPELPIPVLLLLHWCFLSLIFLCLLLFIRDIFLLLLRLTQGARKLATPPFSPGRRQIITAAITMIPAAYGLRQGLAVPDVRHVETWLTRLPKELDGLTLVQITDLHVSPLSREQRVRAVVEKTNTLNPDLILFTGDIVDGLPERRADAIAPLRDLRARYGVFGCVGNHEYYSDYEAWMRTFPTLGLNMLINDHVVLRIRGRELVVAGVPDRVAERFFQSGPDVAKALAGAPEDAIRILLEHRPGRAPENARAGVDLQLSGHTHCGQVPGINQLVANLNNGFLYGWYQVDKMRLYVSSGANSWNILPVRLGVPSEIARIVLRSAA